MTTYPFPGGGTPITEFLINGSWVNTDTAGTGQGNSVRASGGSGGISITRGQASEQGRVGAQSSSFAINNRNGLWSNRNPLSPYFGLIPRFTPVRHRVPGFDSYAYFSPSDQTTKREVRTADKTALDITGDIEIRVDLDPHSWMPEAPMTIVSKYLVTGNQRSWAVGLLSTGQLRFQWSTDGGNVNAVVATSALAVPVGLGRAAIRIQLDVNNGTGWTVAFNYSTTGINGTWLGMGANPSGTPATSIFSSTAALVIGGGDDITNPITGSTPFGGRVYEVQVRNGLGGTLVADPIFSTQAIGATSFTDANSNTWTVGGASTLSRITSDGVRYTGEVNSAPQIWDATGRDAYVNMTSNGPLQRFSIGQTLRSSMTRQFGSASSVGYWPLEDGANSTQNAANVIPGGTPATLYATTMGGSNAGMPGTISVASLQDAGATNAEIIYRAIPTASNSQVFVMCFFKVEAITARTTVLNTRLSGGTVWNINVDVDNAGSGSWHVTLIDTSQTVLDQTTVSFVNSGLPTIDPRLEWVGVNVLANSSGGTVSWVVRWLPVFGQNFFVGVGPNSFSGSIGAWLDGRIENGAGATGVQAAQLFLSNQDVGFVSAVVANAANAYIGETAGARMDRLARENGIPLEVIGNWGDSALMNYQTADTFMNLIYECSDTDGGVLGECRDIDALRYRVHSDIEARRDVSVPYKALTSQPAPTEDNTGFYNSVTATRSSGGSFTRTITTSAYHQLGTDLAGTVVGSGVSTNVSTDTALTDQAGWSAHVGSFDVMRVPNLAIGMHRLTGAAGAPALAITDAMSLDLGDTATLTGLADTPDVIAPDDYPMIVRGYGETLMQSLWTITANTSPAGAYRTGRYDTIDAVGAPRYDTSGSTLSTAVSTTATTLVIAFGTTGDPWTVASGSYPFNILMGGEVITLNSPPSGSTSPQTFTGVTRSVNGIVKAHVVGEAVTLADDSGTYYGR